MEFAKITARGQTTIPKAVRQAAGLRAGDVLAFEIEGDRLVARKVVWGGTSTRTGSREVMAEWLSPEDEKAWRDL